MHANARSRRACATSAPTSARASPMRRNAGCVFMRRSSPMRAGWAAAEDAASSLTSGLLGMDDAACSSRPMQPTTHSARLSSASSSWSISASSFANMNGATSANKAATLAATGSGGGGVVLVTTQNPPHADAASSAEADTVAIPAIKAPPPRAAAPPSSAAPT